MSGPTTPASASPEVTPNTPMATAISEFEVVAGGGEGHGRFALVGEPHAESEGEGPEPHEREVGQQRKRNAGDIPRVAGDLVALQGEEDDDGEQQPVEREGANAGKLLFVPLGPFGPLANRPGEEPCGEWDAEKDQHGSWRSPKW